jgi:NAD+ synthase
MKCDSVVRHISEWLVAQAKESRTKGFVVGVSGGVDSALTSTLCARTGLRTLALSMPIDQAPDQLSRADRHIAWLAQHYSNVEGFKVDLTAVNNSLLSALPDAAKGPLALANSRSRLRMLTLYAFANTHELLVAGTGNKVEDFGIGFFTKYGDGGVDVSPIGDLLKSQVRQLAAYLDVRPDLVNAVPTDGLWGDNRSDEAQIGASYDELEWAMQLHESGKHREAALTERQTQVLEIFLARHEASRHKMECPPICLIPAPHKAA